MNIQTHTSNVIKSVNFSIRISFKFRTTFFNYYTPILLEKQSRVYLHVDNQIHSRNTRSNNHMSILRVNRSKTKHGVLHNGIYVITWIFFPDVFKVNISFSMFESKVRNFYLEKYQEILMLSATMNIFFLACVHLYFFKWNCFRFKYLTVKFPIVSVAVILTIVVCMWVCSCKWDYYYNKIV